MNGGQLLCVPVSFVDWDQYLVHFIYSLVHAGLEETARQMLVQLKKVTQKY